ncbi:MAG: oligosaccharide repeat unit polymerase [Ruminococcus sp.]|nr:oligosaccharide repeat unit polymerase [Ruminococcus sp.]
MEFGIDNIFLPISIVVLFCGYWIFAKLTSKEDLFSPWSITILVWIAIILLYLFYGDRLNPYSGVFYEAIVLWVTGFVMGCGFAYTLQPVKVNKLGNSIPLNKDNFNFLLFLSVITTPLYIYIVFKELGGNYNNFFLTLRENANEGSADVGILVYARQMNLTLLIVALWRFKKTNKILLSYLVSVNILYAVAIMEKGTFFYILIAFAFILKEKGYISNKKIILIFSVFLILSFFFNLIRNNHLGDGTVDFMRFFGSCAKVRG